MKVLILGPDAAPLFRFRRGIAEGLRDLGYEVVFGAPPAAPGVETAVRRAGFSFVPLPLDRAGIDPLKDLRFLFALRDLIRSSAPRALFLTTIKPVLYGSLAARLWHQGPCFSMIAGSGSLFMGRSPLKLLLRTLVKPLLRAGLSRNQAVFFQNREDRNLFLAQGLLADPSKAVLIPGSGVPLDEFPQRPVPSGPLRFLFIGRLLKEKGIGDLAQAASLLKARYPQVRFQALGDLDPNPGSITREDLEGWRGEGALEFPGYIPDVRPALARSSVFVLPSYYREGVPRSTLEALATGRAVVTTDSVGCRETVKDGKNGFLIPPKDPKALADAMEKFILDPSLARRMGKASRALAVSKFDARKVDRIILRTMGLGRAKP